MKVIIDYNLSLKDEREYIDTGKWQLIHKSKKIKEASVPAGFSLMCTGTKIKVNANTNF